LHVLIREPGEIDEKRLEAAEIVSGTPLRRGERRAGNCIGKIKGASERRELLSLVDFFKGKRGRARDKT